MSRINDLIRQCCPNGVPHRTVADVATYVRGLTYSKHEEQDDGPIAVLRSNNITLSSNTLNLADVRRVSGSVRVRENQRLYANDILISAASGSKAHVGKVAYVWDDMDYAFGGFMAVLRTDGAIEPRFLFHLLIGRTFADYLERTLSTTTINNLGASTVGAFRIPLPPVEVQQEIVQVLDLLTSLESELEAQLESELDARRTQYAYYRDSLFTFPKTAALPRIPMGDLGQFIRGRRFTKEDVVDSGIPSIHYGEIYTHYGVAANAAVSHVRSDLAPKLRFAQPGDVVIAAVGETVEDVAKAVAWLGSEPVAIHDDTFLFRADMNPKYVSYVMQSSDFHSQKNKFVARAKVKRLSGQGLAKIMIPVPPRSEQDRVVSILDKFSATLDDLSLRLSAEGSARRIQYQHYRNRLLSFEEAAS
jgi:type I restriction enzyme S subunit